MSTRTDYHRTVILNNSTPVPEAGCWLWDLSCQPSGYGQFSRDGKTYLAHRVAYQAFVGPIPAGLFVCHKCDVRSCVNPAHLFVGTQKDNMADAIRKGRFVSLEVSRGTKAYQAKLTDDAVNDIRTRRLSQREFAHLYGVSKSAVCHAQSGRKWRHV